MGSIREVAKELGIDPEEYVAASRKVQLLDRDYINKSVQYLEEIAAIISQMAYHNYMALHKSIELEQNSRAKARYAVQHMIKMKKACAGTTILKILIKRECRTLSKKY